MRSYFLMPKSAANLKHCFCWAIVNHGRVRQQKTPLKPCAGPINHGLRDVSYKTPGEGWSTIITLHIWPTTMDQWSLCIFGNSSLAKKHPGSPADQTKNGNWDDPKIKDSLLLRGKPFGRLGSLPGKSMIQLPPQFSDDSMDQVHLEEVIFWYVLSIQIIFSSRKRWVWDLSFRRQI